MELKKRSEILSQATTSFCICGIYFLIKNKEIVYVGKSVNIHSRLKAHKEKDFDSFSIIECQESELNSLEAKYIKNFNPPLNVFWTDRYVKPNTNPAREPKIIVIREPFIFECEKHKKIYTSDRMCFACAREKGLSTPWLNGKQPKFIDPWMGE